MGRLHNVFHLWLLHLHSEDPLPGQVRDEEQPAAVHPDVEDDEDYVVESIEDCRINKQMADPSTKRKGLLQYRVRWANYLEGPDNPSWEPYMNLVGSAETVIDYHRRHPTKPKLHSQFRTLASQQDLMMMTLGVFTP